ncbi:MULTISPECIES: lasso RiPP family leader peptide-containing protein [Mesorhizobium]|uniref:Lasso RiPP family leader peptide-containing protein n=1 Tax=Mesorhizobium captivum TaxID=3072319 RepID=A0ABU4Z6P3_9HYPH|nr:MULTISPECIES: lasso RiPP family leader peptide-containing protein [unclassified Mesorhizobium]MDX8450569.1 lasso RiPP family leader peptide-containing protein [Mesorhizobium sp. VK3C]MDX8494892.1 lasso RiPP family leader peptide-containing protein [Mesorhizobium sp. VK22B]MDX8503150.1 lasso RiPP family leader peptide-containing protein [Mesorhizobium sp. VK4C]MDX8509299.1 lasso RiPP family leader peptide-containing protein [Mesorhizobium sp. VK22E]MDX8515602.1 lasso RiPP family leader pepti
MKKTYEKPTVVRKGKLSAVTAVVNGGSVIILR